MSNVTQTKRFFQVKGLNHWQFQPFRNCVCQVRGNVSIVFKLSKELCQFMSSKGRDSTVLQDEKLKYELRDNSSSHFKPSAPLCILMIN